MAYHEDVAMIVEEARALAILADSIQCSIAMFEDRFEKAEAQARACKYPIREFRALMPSIKAKVVIPEAPKIVSSEAPPADDLLGIPPSLRRSMEGKDRP